VRLTSARWEPGNLSRRQCNSSGLALISGSFAGVGGQGLWFEIADYDEDIRGQLSYIGAHRSKGMDFLAVILIDFGSFEELANSDNPDLAEAYFIAASRARQLLGVVVD